LPRHYIVGLVGFPLSPTYYELIVLIDPIHLDLTWNVHSAQDLAGSKVTAVGIEITSVHNHILQVPLDITFGVDPISGRAVNSVTDESENLIVCRVFRSLGESGPQMNDHL
jgi:hypothetical protein